MVTHLIMVLPQKCDLNEGYMQDVEKMCNAWKTCIIH